ncbi:acyltransferase [Tardiphaga alba]|uniref:Acyltransferase n=1 Tax=Tardiphaga alba TaxID=340268 RepID=A0ABX8ACM6_9BRAD|nr:acyltransferase [Tardiphaga alba]QUS41017.1 acyltransferase [Tardiphaga alba]
MGTLRIILALAVVCAHYGMPLSVLTSDIAVQSFFVISGFYMALVLNGKYGPGSYRLFISNRLLRLFPAYLLVLAVSLAVTSKWTEIIALDWSAAIYFVASQLMIVGQEIYFFLVVKDGTLALTLQPVGVPNLLYTFAPIPQAWTLALEIYFYLLAPFIVRRGPVVIFSLLLASLACRMGAQWAFGLSGDPWSYRVFVFELALFCAGTLGYAVYAGENSERGRSKILLMLTAALVFVCLGINKGDGVSALPSVLFLAAVIVTVPRLFELTKTIGWDRYLGELSYPIYICHFLLGWLLMPETRAASFAALALTLIASVAIHHLVERPIDRWRQRRLVNAQHAAHARDMLPAT